MPPSIIFQIYHGNHVLLQEEINVHRENHVTKQVHHHHGWESNSLIAYW